MKKFKNGKKIKKGMRGIVGLPKKAARETGEIVGTIHAKKVVKAEVKRQVKVVKEDYRTFKERGGVLAADVRGLRKIKERLKKKGIKIII